MIDTVVNYEKGEVYTMQIVCGNIDKGEYGLYLRKESFVHQAFEENKNYVGFVNLSGARPRMADLGYKNVFPEKVAIRYSYFTYENAPVRRYVPMPGYSNNYYSTLTKKMDTAISYMTLPQLPREAFFDRDTLRPYYRVDDRTTIGRVPNTIRMPSSVFPMATAPVVSMDFTPCMLWPILPCTILTAMVPMCAARKTRPISIWCRC